MTVPPPMRRDGLEGLGLGLAAFAVYAVLLGAPFQYDDLQYILGNARVVGPWPGWRALLAHPLDATAAYEPLVTALHALFHRLWGETTWPYRLTSLLLHCANAGLLMSLLKRRLKDSGLAFWLALLFALYPAHAEALAVSTFKTHLLAAAACLLVLELMDREPELPLPTSAACAALFAGALFCKETAVLLPALALLSDLSRKPRPSWDRRRAALYAAWGLTLAAYLWWRAAVVPRPLRPPAGGDWLTHILTSGGILFWYLPRLALPLDLCLEHSFPPFAGRNAALSAALLAGALAGLTALLVRLRRRDAALGLGAAWALAALAPFLNLVPFANYSLVADRYLYLAQAGFLLAAGRALDLGLARRPMAKPWALAGLASVTLLYGTLTLRRAALFRDPLALWERTAACAPSNPRAQAAYGSALMGLRLYEPALARLRAAEALDPLYPEPLLDLSLCYAELGRMDEALDAARRRLAARPDAAAWQNLGVLHLRAGDHAAAREYLESAAAAEPGPAAEFNLAACSLAQGRLDEARDRYARLLAAPSLEAKALSGLALIASRRGRREEAIGLYERSLALEPLQTDSAEALAALYARLGRRADAAGLYDRLILALDETLARLGGADPLRYGAIADQTRGLRDGLLRRKARLLGP